MEESHEERLLAVERHIEKMRKDRDRHNTKMKLKLENLATKDDLNQAIRRMDDRYVSRNEFLAFTSLVVTKEDLKPLTDSIDGIAALIKNFKIGVHIGEKIFGVSGKFVLIVGAFATAFIAINNGGHILFAKISAFFNHFK